MKKFTKFLSLVLSGAMLLSLGSCTHRGDSGSGSGSGKLKIWGINPICMPGYDQTLEVDPNETTARYTKWLIESFKEENPDIDISLETAGWELELNKNIMTAIAGGTQPDVMATATYTPLLSRYGHLMQLTLDKEIEDDLTTSLDDFCFHQGKRYAVPVTQELFSVAINKGVLRKAGIINADDSVNPQWEKYNPLAPATWEDVLAISQGIKQWASTKSGDDAKIGGFLMCPTKQDSHVRALAFMACAGGDFADNYGNVYLDSPENVKAYTYMRELWKTAPEGNSGETTLGNLNALFYQGRAAYGFLNPEYVLPSISGGGYPQCRPEDVVFAELPHFEGSTLKANVSTGGILFAVLDESENQEGAKKFIEHLLSHDAQKNIFEIIGRIPVRKSVLMEIQQENSEAYKRSKTIIDPFLDDSYTINKGIPTIENNSSLCWDTWNSMWRKVFTSDEDIAALLKNCSQKWVNYMSEED